MACEVWRVRVLVVACAAVLGVVTRRKRKRFNGRRSIYERALDDDFQASLDMQRREDEMSVVDIAMILRDIISSSIMICGAGENACADAKHKAPIDSR